MVAIVKETTEAMVSAVDGMTAGVAGMTAGVTAEATIAVTVVIAMKGGQKTEDLPIAMVSFEF